MDIKELENYVVQIHNNLDRIHTYLVHESRYSHYRNDNFTYIILYDNVRNTHNTHRVNTNNNVPIFSVEQGELQYILDNTKLVTHDLYIDESWHFQLSTVNELLSLEHIKLIQDLYEKL